MPLDDPSIKIIFSLISQPKYILGVIIWSFASQLNEHPYNCFSDKKIHIIFCFKNVLSSIFVYMYLFKALKKVFVIALDKWDIQITFCLFPNKTFWCEYSMEASHRYASNEYRHQKIS